ncbi:hypothetical protein SMICM304S_01562 [Streptomyces microflavus]
MFTTQPITLTLSACASSTTSSVSRRMFSASVAAPAAFARSTMSPLQRLAMRTVRTPGTSRAISVTASSWNEETSTRPTRSRASSTSASARAAATSLISAWSGASTASRTSSKTGTRSPFPASSSRSSARVLPAIGPVPSVVRSTAASCITASAPSLLRCRSSSMASIPASCARTKERRVFSGSTPITPR